MCPFLLFRLLGWDEAELDRDLDLDLDLDLDRDLDLDLDLDVDLDLDLDLDLERDLDRDMDLDLDLDLDLALDERDRDLDLDLERLLLLTVDLERIVDDDEAFEELLDLGVGDADSGLGRGLGKLRPGRPWTGLDTSLVSFLPDGREIDLLSTLPATIFCTGRCLDNTFGRTAGFFSGFAVTRFLR